MNKFSEEDRPLVEFLRQHSPCAPPAGSELEDRVLQGVEPLLPLQRSPKRHLWLVSGTLAAGFLAAIALPSIFTPTPVSEAEAAQLEAYMERHWGEVVAGNEADLAETDLWLLDDSTFTQKN